jgi:hypothetical protein
VIGHPGHELKVFGWMSEYAPRVYVITDGSGRSGISRIPSTAPLIAAVGAQPGEIFGFISDARIYQAMLTRDFTFFFRLVDALAESFVNHDIDFVAGDACEGFNPTHDLCRTIINAAVLKAGRITRRCVANLELYLTEWEPNCQQQTHDDQCVHWVLDHRLLAAKLEAADAYAELRDEVRQALALRGEEYFRVECMRPVTAPGAVSWRSGKPLYETWGEQRVTEGGYHSVIRFNNHISPIMNALLADAAPASPRASRSSNLRVKEAGWP